MAGLAGNVDLRPGGRERVGFEIVVLAKVGGVTRGALGVPVLKPTRPVEGVVVGDALVGIEVEPALSALILRPRVPGEAQRLIAAVWKRHEILLQRSDAKSVCDLEVVKPAIRPFRVDEERIPPLIKGRRDPAVPQRGVVEIAEDRLRARLLHGEIVMRSGPALQLGSVTAGAHFSSHVGWAGGGDVHPGRRGIRRPCAGRNGDE